MVEVTAFDPLVPDLARAVRPREAGTRILIGVVGEPGAGKSTVAAALVAALGAPAVQVPMDGYHLADRVLELHGSRDRKGAPDTFDGWGYLALLDRLRTETDHDVYAPQFERDLEQPLANAVPVTPAHTVVVSEGNYLLLDADPWPAVRARFDQVWFVAMDDGVRLDRLIARHVEYGKSPEAARAWVLANDEPNARLIRATRDRADLVLETTRLPMPHGPGLEG